MALPVYFRERYAGEAQAQILEKFSCERPILFRCWRCYPAGFIQCFDDLTDQIILELRTGSANSARFVGDGRLRQPGFLAILGDRARMDISEGQPHLAKKCIEYVGCALEGLPDRLASSWFMCAGGGLLSVAEPIGEGGLPPTVTVFGAADSIGHGAGFSPEWEALVVQVAREALLCVVGVSCLAIADVTKSQGDGVEEELLSDLVVAAESATRVVLQVPCTICGLLAARFETSGFNSKEDSTSFRICCSTNGSA
jgi:hypothetical protein